MAAEFMKTDYGEIQYQVTDTTDKLIKENIGYAGVNFVSAPDASGNIPTREGSVAKKSDAMQDLYNFVTGLNSLTNNTYVDCSVVMKTSQLFNS